jgi:hypothetical protein
MLRHEVLESAAAMYILSLLLWHCMLPLFGLPLS